MVLTQGGSVIRPTSVIAHTDVDATTICGRVAPQLGAVSGSDTANVRFVVARRVAFAHRILLRHRKPQARTGTMRIVTRSVSEEERRFLADASGYDDPLLYRTRVPMARLTRSRRRRRGSARPNAHATRKRVPGLRLNEDADCAILNRVRYVWPATRSSAP